MLAGMRADFILQYASGVRDCLAWRLFRRLLGLAGPSAVMLRFGDGVGEVFEDLAWRAESAALEALVDCFAGSQPCGGTRLACGRSRCEVSKSFNTKRCATHHVLF